MADNRTRYLLLFFVLVAVFAFAIYRWRTGPSDFGQIPKGNEVRSLLGRPLRVALVSWPGYAGGIVANNGFSPNRECLYWKEHQLEVEFKLIEDNDAIGKGLANGTIDVIWTTVDSWANQLPNFIDGGVHAKAFLQVDWSRGGDAIVADSRIQNIEGLKGKRVALAILTPSEWFLESKLSSSQLSETDRRSIQSAIVGKSASPDARVDFVANRVDAAVVWEPDVALALKGRKGAHILASTLRDQNLLADIMVARSDFIAQFPQVVQAFVMGWFDGTAAAESDRSNVARLLVNNEPLYKELGYDETLRQLSLVKWADRQDNTVMFGLDGQPPLFDQIYSKAAQYWMRRGVIKRVVDPSEAKDTTFVRKALEAK